MTDWRPPFIETERLYLRPIELGDAESIFMYASDPEVAQQTTWYPHGSLDDTFEFLNSYVFKNYERQVPEPWAIVLKENPEMVIGTVGLDWKNRDLKCMELRYALSQVFWGAGVMTEAAHAVLDYAFHHYQLKRIEAKTLVGNSNSQKVLRKLGFQEEGTLRCVTYQKGQFTDVKMFSVIDTDRAAFSQAS